MAEKEEFESEEEESSLDQFEEELLKEEMKKSRVNFLVSIVVVLAIGVGAYFAYEKYVKQMFTPETATQEPLQTGPSPLEMDSMETDAGTPAPAETVEEPASPMASEEAPMEGEGTEMEGGIMAPPASPEIKVETVDSTKASAPAAEQVAKAAKMEEKMPADKESAKKETKGKDMMPPMPKESATHVADMPTAQVAGGKYTIQVGVFAKKSNADRMMDRVKKLGFDPATSTMAYPVDRITVFVNKYPFREMAVKGASELMEKGLKPKVTLTGPGNYSLEMGKFDTEKDADSLVKSLEGMGYNVWLGTRKDKVQATVVNIRGVSDEGLEGAKALLKKEGIPFFARHAK